MYVSSCLYWILITWIFFLASWFSLQTFLLILIYVSGNALTEPTNYVSIIEIFLKNLVDHVFELAIWTFLNWKGKGDRKIIQSFSWSDRDLVIVRFFNWYNFGLDFIHHSTKCVFGLNIFRWSHCESHKIMQMLPYEYFIFYSIYER